MVHWGYKLSCTLEAHHIVVSTTAFSHGLKGVVVVDDDVTAPVPAEFPTSRRAPAGATMPGVLGGGMG